MSDYLCTRDAADKLGVTPSRVRQLCREGFAPGALPPGCGRRDWLIPAAALDAMRDRPPKGRPKKSGAKSA